MAEQNETHFEIQDSNKAKAYEEQKAMREELIEWVKTCDKLHMGELFSEMRRMKRSWDSLKDNKQILFEKDDVENELFKGSKS